MTYLGTSSLGVQLWEVPGRRFACNGNHGILSIGLRFTASGHVWRVIAIMSAKDVVKVVREDQEQPPVVEMWLADDVLRLATSLLDHEATLKERQP